MIELTYRSKAPAHLIDAAFFHVHKDRQFRARPWQEVDHPGFEGVCLFDGCLGQPINWTIIKDIGQARYRRSYYVAEGTRLGTDAEIVAYLLSRGIDPAEWLLP